MFERSNITKLSILSLTQDPILINTSYYANKTGLIIQYHSLAALYIYIYIYIYISFLNVVYTY